ncbi:MAG: cation-transporting P-type ATPase, partial [Candidatus Aenigmarchaeota archaeon]|nr:cation-transporting P-type ATPase [Candidatus Aenigmarchaeota archaeon]
AMLTGESVPTEKIASTIVEGDLTPGDQRNMAFMGTVVVHGRAKGIVVATGSQTTLGKIALEVKDVGIVKAPIQKKISTFARNIGILVVAASLVVFVVGILLGGS